MKKLLFITPAYIPGYRYGGPIQSVHLLSSQLKKIGFPITVYTTTLFQESNHYFTDLIDGVEVHYFPVVKLPVYWFSPDFDEGLRENIHKFNVVFISSLWEYTTLSGMKRALEKGVPYFVIPRGMLQRTTFKSKFWKKYPFYKFFFERFLQRAEGIIFTTEREREDTFKMVRINTKSLVIPNGIDTASFDKLPGKDALFKDFPGLKGKFLILFMGRFVWTKGIDVLLDGFSRLLKDLPDVHLIMAGGSPEYGYGKKIKGWTKKMGLKEYVTFAGFVEGEKKLRLLSGCDAFVMPSYSENFGMAAVEAMASGLPVLVSNRVGIYREIVKEKAGIVVNPNGSQIYKGLKTLISNSKLRKELAKRGKYLAHSHFSIERISHLYEKIIKNL